MDNKIIKLLTRFVNDECSGTELKDIKQILESGNYSTEWNHVISEAEINAVSGSLSSSDLSDARSQEIFARILASNSRETVVAGNRNERKIMWNWLSAAAAAMFVILASFLLSNILTSANSLDLVEVVTEIGEQKLVTLPDGSTVRLDDLSKISYPVEFTEDARVVTLEGKAFFDIESDVDRPFSVFANEIEVNVLGTAFGVRAYNDDHEIAVLVESGSVRVVETSGGINEIDKLTPGEQITVDRETRVYRFSRIAREDTNAWKDGRLVFHDEPFGDVLRAVERRYNVKIDVADQSVYSQRITFKQNGDVLEDVLKILSLVVGLEFEIVGNRVSMK